MLHICVSVFLSVVQLKSDSKCHVLSVTCRRCCCYFLLHKKEMSFASVAVPSPQITLLQESPHYRVATQWRDFMHDPWWTETRKHALQQIHRKTLGGKSIWAPRKTLLRFEFIPTGGF